ncbi:reverse transcriptase domain-containing protein [Tanacetum coccineum]
MSTRSSTRNLFPPLEDPKCTIRRKTRVDPNSLNDFEEINMAANKNGDDGLPPAGGGLPVPDLRTMEELCQPTLNGRGGPIAPIAIQATNFGLKNDMIQQVQNSCPFRGPGDDANKHLDKFLHVTQSMKVNGVSDDALRLYLFPYSLQHRAAKWFDRLPRNSITTFDQMAKIFLGKYFPPSMVTKLRNDITNFHQEPDESLFRAWERNKLTLRHRDTINADVGDLKLENGRINNKLNQMLATKQQSEIPEDLKGITTRSGVVYKGPTIPNTSSSPKVVERKTEVTKDTVPPTNNGVPRRPTEKPSIPYPSRLNDQKLHEKANNQMEKYFQIFQDLYFDISFANALILMPKFASTIKSLLTNKEKLFELARTPLNEHCSAVLLKMLPEKLRDPDKFLIPCDFPGMDECLALADLGASINIMPLFVWKKLPLLELTHYCHESLGTCELVDFDADPRVPLILRRSFLKTGCALIDVYGGELTLRVGNEAVTFNLDQTLRYSSNYDDNSVNRINIIDVAYEEYSQEVLGFSVSGNPTPSTEPIVSTSSPTLTPFEDSDFLLEETDAFLAIEDEPISSKTVEPKNKKSSIENPPEVELKDLPTHLEYAFLEGTDKLPIIIAKDLKDEEKAALIKFLKSHKQAIAWKLSDIKGINQEFCTHKILMEDDFKPAVQHQRRVNPKIHEVDQRGVLKLLIDGLIYPISDSPWVSPVHYVPKKGGFTVVENEENELIPTLLVTGWCLCIDYRKLNDVTRKDHFPLPFMDQMLERLVGNE